MARENAHERAARQLKVAKLMAIVELLDQMPSADEVAEWGPRTWGLLAQTAGVRMPSPESIALLVKLLRIREDARKAS